VLPQMDCRGYSLGWASFSPRFRTDVQSNRHTRKALLDTSIFQQLREAARRLMVELHLGMILSPYPVTKITSPQHERNAEIRARYRAGESLHTLAENFGISEQRVYQIVQGRRK
jgi:Mor family transcriptional regulator